MRSVKEVIIVEGRYDKNAVSQAVDATIIETNGFGIFSDKEKLSLVRKLSEKRGVIVLTDGDGAGFLIRSHLSGAVKKDNIKHAYIPDIYGKERRKTKASREGKLGVEGMRPEVIVQALERCGATFMGDEKRPSTDVITKADFFAAGLSGAPLSAARRGELIRKLELPERITANGLLEVLNIIMTREEFLAMF